LGSKDTDRHGRRDAHRQTAVLTSEVKQMIADEVKSVIAERQKSATATLALLTWRKRKWNQVHFCFAILHTSSWLR
jgi:hypothetical protein